MSQQHRVDNTPLASGSKQVHPLALPHYEICIQS